MPFLLHGQGFPVHKYFRGLMFFYGLQMHLLTPNGILNITYFITLCELFLGIEPHFGLRRQYF